MNNDLSLYIHIPWCTKKCPYCDFNSHVANDNVDEQYYIDALLKDLSYDVPYIGNRKISSIFFGGGTPSLFSAKSIGRIMAGIRQQCVLNDNCEITLELNPDSGEYKKLKDYRSIGINRLSIGIQSFADKQLHLLGRIHDVNCALKAFSHARRANFTNINIDLMYLLPEQSGNEIIKDVKQAISMDAEHISWYQLTIEPNTYFYNHTPMLATDESVYKQWHQSCTLLRNNHYKRYETSAWAKPNYQCRHNLNYWQFGDYLGIGAGASSKLSFNDGGKIEIIRTRKKCQPQHYLSAYTKHNSTKQLKYGEHSFVAERTILTKEDMVLEFMMNALRLEFGCPQKLFKLTTGLNLKHWQHIIDELKAENLWRAYGRIGLKAKGRRMLNEVLLRFMPTPSPAHLKNTADRNTKERIIAHS